MSNETRVEFPEYHADIKSINRNDFAPTADGTKYVCDNVNRHLRIQVKNEHMALGDKEIE